MYVSASACLSEPEPITCQSSHSPAAAEAVEIAMLFINDVRNRQHCSSIFMLKNWNAFGMLFALAPSLPTSNIDLTHNIDTPTALLGAPLFRCHKESLRDPPFVVKSFGLLSGDLFPLCAHLDAFAEARYLGATVSTQLCSPDLGCLVCRRREAISDHRPAPGATPPPAPPLRRAPHRRHVAPPPCPAPVVAGGAPRGRGDGAAARRSPAAPAAAPAPPRGARRGTAAWAAGAAAPAPGALCAEAADEGRGPGGGRGPAGRGVDQSGGADPGVLPRPLGPGLGVLLGASVSASKDHGRTR